MVTYQRKWLDGGSSKKVQTLNKQEDDVFMAHPSDSPTAVLVSHLLTVDNYGTWVRSMRWLYERRTSSVLLMELHQNQMIMMVVNGNTIMILLDLRC